jgi:outer membrane protein
VKTHWSHSSCDCAGAIIKFRLDSYCAVLALLLSLAVCVPAQQTVQTPAQVSTELTLEDCVRLAESAPNAIDNARRERQIADLGVTQARAGFYPQAHFQSDFVYNSPNLVDRSTGSFVALNGIREYTLLPTLTQEFDTSGRIRADVKRARANQDLSRISLDIIRRDLRRSVAVAYYRLLLTRRLVEVTRIALDESRSFEQRTNLLFASGEAARADVVKASSQVAAQQQALSSAELEAQLANQELASFWTNNVNEPVKLTDALDRIPPPPDTPTANEPADPYLRRFEFSLLEAQRRGFEADAKRARSAVLPQLNFVFQYGIDSNAVRWQDRGYAAFFSLRIPLFDWHRASSEKRQFTLRQEQVETSRGITERTLSREYKSALARVDRFFQQIAMTREQIRLAEDDLSLSRLRYEAGEGAALDVVAAQIQLAQARNNYYTSLANYLNARIDLEVASGK